MAKVVLTDLTSLTNEASAVATLSANNTAIEEAVENTLSRDGTAPNEMQAPLDMNSNRIVNLPDPASANDAARLIDITNLMSGTATIPPAPSAITRGGVFTHPAVANEFLTSINADGTSTGRRPVVADLLGGVTWTDVSGKPAWVSVDTTDTTNINYNQGGTSAQTRTLKSRLQDQVSVLDYIPQAQHAAIQNFTTTYDATTAIQACINANAGIREIYIPYGKYIVTSTLKWRPANSVVFPYGLRMRGDGAAQTIFDNRCAATARSDNFAVVNGSVIVTVTRNSHGYSAEDTIEITGSSGPIGGLNFDGTWSITSVTTNTFTFNHTSGAGSTTNGTVSYNEVNPLFDIGVTGSFGSYQMWIDFFNFKVDNLTAVTNTTAFRLRKAYHATIENVWITNQTRDGVEILCIDSTAGDRDAGNQYTIRHCRIENITRWGLFCNSRTATATGNNETSYVGVHDTFFQSCGVDSATVPPPSGAIRWKGQVLDVHNMGTAICKNVALYIEGGAGLANTVTCRGFTAENTTRRGIYITGLTQGSFRDIQLYNNDGNVATNGFTIDGTNFVCSQIRVDGCVLRATAGNNPYTAFTLTGANADAKSCYVAPQSVTLGNFGYAGQTLFSGMGYGAGGVADNSNAIAGYVGEYTESIVASGAAVAITSNVAKTITSITLGPGDWDVSGVCGYIAANTTTVTVVGASLSTTTNTLDTTTGRFIANRASYTGDGTSQAHSSIGPYRFSLSASTTIYLVGITIFGTSTSTAFGIIRARRVR